MSLVPLPAGCVPPVKRICIAAPEVIAVIIAVGSVTEKSVVFAVPVAVNL
jgi:hypothetical protein